MKQKYFSLLVAIVAIALVSSLVIGLNGFSSAVVEASPQHAENTLPRTITVVGEGKVPTEPDMAQITVGVDVTKFTVKEAATESAKIMEALMTALKAQGVAPKDMQTSGYNVYIEQPPYPADGAKGGEAKYHFSNSVAIAIRDLKKMESVLGAAIDAGANNIYGVTFDLSDPSKVKAEARQKAVNNAKAKAEELAKLNGVKVGQVVSISEVIGGTPGVVYNSAPGYGGGGPISPGQLDLSVQLQITYALE